MQYNTLVFQLHYLSDAYNVHFLLKPCQDDAASTERVLSGIKLDCDHFQSIHVLLSSRHTQWWQSETQQLFLFFFTNEYLTLFQGGLSEQQQQKQQQNNTGIDWIAKPD